MKKLFLFLFVALVGCSSGAFCETPTRAACPPIDGVNQIAFCIAPGVDAQSCQDDVTSCEFGTDIDEATCSDDVGPTCPDGWTLHCY